MIENAATPCLPPWTSAPVAAMNPGPGAVSFQSTADGFAVRLPADAHCGRGAEGVRPRQRTETRVPGSASGAVQHQLALARTARVAADWELWAPRSPNSTDSGADVRSGGRECHYTFPAAVDGRFLGGSAHEERGAVKLSVHGCERFAVRLPADAHCERAPRGVRPR